MRDRVFISRADDLGSSHSANRAIAMVADAGFIRNVSIMACGPAVEAAAKMLATRKDICFGMHTTLNAEWDLVKWKPIQPLTEASGLVDPRGSFLPDPSLFLTSKPAVETIMSEVSAQLERLHHLGFDIRYVDTHMFPEMFVEGLDQAMEDFCKQKGLLDHMYFYNLPPELPDWTKGCDALPHTPSGQYFWVIHPSLDTEEMHMTGNSTYSGKVVAAARAGETAIFSNTALCHSFREGGIRGIRYDEATFDRRLTVEDMKQIISAL